MKKLIFTIFLFFSCAVMAGTLDVKCPADRPLADWDGNCYSCDEDKDLYSSLNGPCEEVCPNRMYMSMPLLVPDWAGCVLDTPSNRIMSFINKYFASFLFAIIPVFIMMLYLLTVSIRWTYRRIKSKILTFILWFFTISGAVMIPGSLLAPVILVFAYCFCFCYMLRYVYNIIRNTKSKDKKVKKEAIKSLVILGIYGVLLGGIAKVFSPHFALMIFNLLLPIYVVCLLGKKEKQRREKK